MTGANYLLESGETKILVDCGMIQGSKYVDKRNFEPFPYDPKSIAAVLVTHAHIDHVGRIPKLMKDGFHGTVYSTPPTKDFAELLLLDSEHIISNEAEREGLPQLYSAEDVTKVMEMWRGQKYHEPLAIGPFNVEFFDAGHILGSATIRITAEGKRVVFSGDLGNSPAPIIHETEAMPDTDYCLIESTYGNRIHESSDAREGQLEDAIEETVKDKGVLMIPAFAMERTQDLLYHMNRLVQEGRVPKVPVYIDSPLAIKLTAIYKKYENYFNKETEAIVKSGDDILNFPGLHLTLTTEQSKEINDVPPPKVIMAGSGMSNGGRILHHEMRYLSGPNNCILFVGYQAVGTLGRAIMDGAKEVKIYGETVPVRCQKKSISAYSAHADQPRLLAWIAPQRENLKKVFVVQGEEDSSEVLREKIQDELAIKAEVPQAGESVVL